MPPKSALRCKNEYKAMDQVQKGQKDDDKARLPVGVELCDYDAQVPTEFSFKIDCDRAMTEDFSLSPNMLETLHFGVSADGDDSSMYPKRTMKVARAGVFNDLVLLLKLDAGVSYPYHKAGDVSLKLNIANWKEVQDRLGDTKHQNITEDGNFLITDNAYGMYSEQSPFTQLTGELKDLRIALIVRHVLILLECPFMNRCGEQ